MTNTASEHTVVRSFADGLAVLSTDQARQASHRESLELYGDTLLLLDDGPHTERRRFEIPLFARDALLAYEARVVEPALDELLAGLARHGSTDAGTVAVDLVVLLDDLLLDLAGAVVGLDLDGDREALSELRGLVRDLAAAAHVEWATGDHDAIRRRGLEARDRYLERFIQPALDRRVAAPEAAPLDLLALVAAGAPPALTGEVLVRETILYLMAATQTVMHAVPHVVDELHRWGGDQLDAPWRRDLGLLKAASSEALRLHPPVPALLRETTEPLQLPGGEQVPAGVVVRVELASCNRDTEVFGADADRFDPTRELPVGVAPHGLSFGGGIHTCIGRGLTVGPAARSTAADYLGIMPRLLRGLYAAELRPDPDHPSEHTVSSEQGYHTSYPVLLVPAGAEPAPDPIG